MPRLGNDVWGFARNYIGKKKINQNDVDALKKLRRVVSIVITRTGCQKKKVYDLKKNTSLTSIAFRSSSRSFMLTPRSVGAAAAAAKIPLARESLPYKRPSSNDAADDDKDDEEKDGGGGGGGRCWLV